MEPVDRDVVRSVLSVLVPREAPGVALYVSGRTIELTRDSPIPWDVLEEAARSGEEVRFGLLEPLDRVFFLWARFDGAGISELSSRFYPSSPAAIVAEPDGCVVFWRVHPVTASEASGFLSALSDRLRSSPAALSDSWRLPLTAQHAAVFGTTPTVWSAAILPDAVAFLREAVYPETVPPPTPVERTPEACKVPEAPPLLRWEEIENFVREEPGKAAAAVLQLVIDRYRGDPEEVLERLGIASAAVVGEEAMVLRGEAWYRPVVRSAVFELVLAPEGPLYPAGRGGTASSRS